MSKSEGRRFDLRCIAYRLRQMIDDRYRPLGNGLWIDSVILVIETGGL